MSALTSDLQQMQLPLLFLLSFWVIQVVFFIFYTSQKQTKNFLV